MKPLFVIISEQNEIMSEIMISLTMAMNSSFAF